MVIVTEQGRAQRREVTVWAQYSDSKKWQTFSIADAQSGLSWLELSLRPDPGS